MHQIPLDHVVLQLRSQISDRSVVDILRRVLDPPDLTHIKHAFASLFQYGYISEASDEGEITDSGAIAVKLGLDLTLTKLVIYGIHLGVAKETVYMAAALAQQDLPFRKASEYIHTPKELNEIVRDTISGQAFFDRGCVRLVSSGCTVWKGCRYNPYVHPNFTTTLVCTLRL